jgi:hypothetical protein
MCVFFGSTGVWTHYLTLALQVLLLLQPHCETYITSLSRCFIICCSYVYAFAIEWHLSLNCTLRGDPRRRLEGGSRQHEFCKSKIFLRCWRHTWQKKNHQEPKLWHPNLQPIQSFSMPGYNWENRRAPMPQDAGSKPAWEMQANRWTNKQHVEFPQLPLG